VCVKRDGGKEREEEFRPGTMRAVVVVVAVIIDVEGGGWREGEEEGETGREVELCPAKAGFLLRVWYVGAVVVVVVAVAVAVVVAAVAAVVVVAVVVAVVTVEITVVAARTVCTGYSGDFGLLAKFALTCFAMASGSAGAWEASSSI
jgi:hypothetical protein